MRKATVSIAVSLLILSSVPGVGAGSYHDLEPGASKKDDADRLLGSPLREIVPGERYDYPPDNDDARRVSIRIDPLTGTILAIDIHPVEGYDSARYREWFELGDPGLTEYDDDGNLIEYYDSRGIALHFFGPEAGSKVRFFRHYVAVKTAPRGDDDERPTPPLIPNLADLIEAIDEAEKAEDWQGMRAFVDEGLIHYADSADLWSARAHLLFKSSELPAERRSDEILRAATRAYELDPTSVRALDLGWVHFELFSGCALALHYFEQAEAEQGAKHPPLYFYMATCYERTGDLQQAAAYYIQFLDAAPDHEDAESARYRLGELLEQP